MFYLAWRGFRGQKRMAQLMVAVLLISFLFLTLSSVVASSVRDFQQKQREALYGRHQLLYVGNRDFARSLQEQFPGVEISRIAGKTDGGKTVGSISESYQQVANLTLKEGRLPQEENEILLVDPENWDYQVGDQVRISYEFSYIFKQAGEVTHSLQDALLEGLNQNREYYLDLAAELWDPFVQSDSGASTLPVHMLHPMNELTAEQQDEAFLMFAALLPEFALTSAGDQHHFETKEFGKLQAYLTSGYSKTVLNGEGFGENQGTSISGGSHLVSSEIFTTYTVCGIAESYENQWNAGGLDMPDAFVREGDCQQLWDALRAIEADHPEVRAQTGEAVALFYQDSKSLEDHLEPVLQAYESTYGFAYQLSGTSQEGGGAADYLTGLDPERGEPVTYGVTVSGQRGTIRLQNERYEFTLQDLSDPDFRLPGLDPMPLEPVTLESLYQNNTGPLRINYLTYPQVGDATQTVELLLSGVLVCMSACACFQLYLQSIRRRKQKMETLVALGATDGQILAVLFLEVWMLLIFSGVLGSLLGMGLSAWVLPQVMHVPVAVDLHRLLLGYLCNIAAVLVGAMLPAWQLRDGKGVQRSLRAAPGARPAMMGKGRPGYRQVWMRHCAVNQKQTLLRGFIALLLAAILLLPLFLSHRAYGPYREKVTNTGRPDFGLSLPYAAAPRYLEEMTGEMEVPCERAEAYVTAENVLLHCDALLERSPMLQALRQDPRGGELFVQPSELGALCTYVRIIGADWESDLVQQIVKQLGNSINQEDFDSGKACVVLIPRYRQAGESPVMTDISTSALWEISKDQRAGALMTCSYLPQYAGVYGEEHSVTSGMMLTLSGQTQVLRGMDAPYLEETLYTTQTEVAAVVYELEAAVWPLSDTGGKGGITILSGYPLVSSVYPKASTRMSAEQSKHFLVASQLFYPDCYGKTYLALWQGEQGGEVSEDLKKVTDFAAKFDFTVENYALENQKLWESGRNASAVDLMMGLNMLLITVMLLANLMTAEMEADRRRLGVLQAVGMTGGQYVLGQSIQAFLQGLAGLLLTHILVLAVVCAGLLFQGGGIPMLFSRLQLLFQGYHWEAHGLLCIAALVLFWSIQMLVIWPVLRKNTAENIKV